MKKPYATYGYKPQNTTHHETTLLYINNPTFHHKPQPVLSASILSPLKKYLYLYLINNSKPQI